MTILNAMSAFSTTGIYPFCPTKVSATDTTDKCKKLLEATSLPFLKFDTRGLSFDRFKGQLNGDATNED